MSVDRWWADLLRKGAKVITEITWVPLGNSSWELVVTWVPVGEGEKFNVGLPKFVDIDDTELFSLKEVAYETFEDAWGEYQLVLEHLRELDVLDDNDKPLEVIPDHIGPVDRMVLEEYLFPLLNGLSTEITYFVSFTREIEAELTARASDDYFKVRVDRNLLGSTFTEQVGFENVQLFS